MEMNKFMRVVWSINGVLILFVMGLACYKLIEEMLDNEEYKQPEVIVGEEFEKAKEKGLILQGLEVQSPLRIVGSSGYAIPLSIKTYDVPQEMRFKLESSRYTPDFSSDDLGEFGQRSNLINVLFVSDDFVIGVKLLSTKGFIQEFKFPSQYRPYLEQENKIHYNTYLISLDDSNQDGLINQDDASDLYLSGLQGENLTQVTNGLDISSYRFLSESEILITYFSTKEAREEYKRPSFMRYKIIEKKLEELNSLNDVLNNMEAELSK